jgi:hypothetical protein
LEIRRIAGNRVTLALDAPRNIRILRGELEAAAREFRACETANGKPAGATPPVATPASVPILHSLPAEPVERHCVT